MIIHTDIQQNTTDWEILRSGKITASEADALITPLGKIRTGDGVKTYLAQKLTEQWTGGPLMSLQGSFDMEQGQIIEERAKPGFTLHTGLEIHNVAFIESDDHLLGCSPDAMVVGHNVGVEVKAPRIDTQIRYLLDGKMPLIYLAQLQFSMFVTGAQFWHFFSYNRGTPPLHIVVERDDEFQCNIAQAVKEFSEMLTLGMEKLIRLNGGVRRTYQRPLTPMPPSEPEFTSEMPT